MNKNRLEAFSDGVIAIIITIMVLEIKTPHDTSVHELLKLTPVFLSYMISFVFVGIYWNNHHHLLHTVRQVNARIMWANLNFLFWLSLIPFATGWLGENHRAILPMVLYSVLCLLCGFAYSLLKKSIVRSQDPRSESVRVLNSMRKKEMLSIAFYVLAFVFAHFDTYISYFFIIITSVMWFIPNKNIESLLEND